MIKLNLTPQNKQEELILTYLQNNASETLADKINNGTPFEKDGHPLLNKKTLSGFMKYACDEARKLAEKGANSACIDDVTVYCSFGVCFRFAVAFLLPLPLGNASCGIAM